MTPMVTGMKGTFRMTVSKEQGPFIILTGVFFRGSLCKTKKREKVD